MKKGSENRGLSRQIIRDTNLETGWLGKTNNTLYPPTLKRVVLDKYVILDIRLEKGWLE